MKRFVLYSLSATVALAVSSVARAEVPSASALLDRDARNLMAQQQEERDEGLTDGVISPTPQSPNNRVIPGQGELDSDGTQQEQDEGLTDGVISPTPQSPNNRVIPGQGELDSDGIQQDRDEGLTDGVISPTPQSPNNRVVPGQGALDSNTMQAYPGETFYSQQCRQNLASGVWQEPARTGGIISPDDRSPYNRAFPRGPVSLEPDQTIDELGNSEYQYMECRNYLETQGYDYDEDSYAPTSGIISPQPQTPNNRVVPGSGTMN